MEFAGRPSRGGGGADLKQRWGEEAVLRWRRSGSPCPAVSFVVVVFPLPSRELHRRRLTRWPPLLSLSDVEASLVHLACSPVASSTVGRNK
ncbi:quinoprotein [Sesbania bispinosa]|nr:quinoprotein [Sesbania bispinosa]